MRQRDKNKFLSTIKMIDPSAIPDEDVDFFVLFLKDKGHVFIPKGRHSFQGVVFDLKYNLSWRSRKSEEERSSDIKNRITGERYEVIGEELVGEGGFASVIASKGTLILLDEGGLLFKTREKGKAAEKQRVAKFEALFGSDLDQWHEKLKIEYIKMEKAGNLHPKRHVFFQLHSTPHSVVFMRRQKGVTLHDFIKKHQHLNANLCFSTSIALLAAYNNQVASKGMSHGDLHAQNTMVNLTPGDKVDMNIIDPDYKDDPKGDIAYIAASLTMIWDAFQATIPPDANLHPAHILGVITQIQADNSIENKIDEMLSFLMLQALTYNAKRQAYFQDLVMAEFKAKNIYDECKSYLNAHPNQVELIHANLDKIVILMSLLKEAKLLDESMSVRIFSNINKLGIIKRITEILHESRILNQITMRAMLDYQDSHEKGLKSSILLLSYLSTNKALNQAIFTAILDVSPEKISTLHQFAKLAKETDLLVPENFEQVLLHFDASKIKSLEVYFEFLKDVDNLNVETYFKLMEYPEQAEEICQNLLDVPTKKF